MKTYHLTNPLMRDSDVAILQKALAAHQYYHGPIDGIFGMGTADGCKTAKFALGYKLNEVVPSGGPFLLKLLTGASLPPDYVSRQKSRELPIELLSKLRQAIVADALWGVQNEGAIGYEMLRPMENIGRKNRHKLPWKSDCSEYVTTIYSWNDGPDPNNFGFNGLGNTGTMLDNGTTIPLYQALPADVIIWGRYPGHHTAIIVDTTNKLNPELVSHGTNRGPLKISLAVENYYQLLPYVVKRYINHN